MTTPRTAAGRRHVSALVGLLGGEDWWTTSVLAIEAEARAAALDEARDDAADEAERRIAAAIDALRERSEYIEDEARAAALDEARAAVLRVPSKTLMESYIHGLSALAAIDALRERSGE